MSYNQPNTQEIPTDWGTWNWDATSIGTTAALCVTLFVIFTMLCIVRCRRNLRIARSQIESAGAPVDLEAANTTLEKVVDDGKVQTKQTISESPVFETPFIPMPLAAYFPHAYRYYEDAEERKSPVYSPQRESYRY
ncbi:hypothetical protein Moror_2805 [Moniliophthora roreri MCA 2997]|uniref:Uncharacterized protein n=2 Tax=Moniliophthora roreri TaxID=221103 RepID=V2XC98_MONRO|nr:hypothetical protein Moror_2805 [Moniliophthora roreri MCA 2997]